jgi:RNA polymerase sigma-70 factor, ECF subfamily
VTDGNKSTMSAAEPALSGPWRRSPARKDSPDRSELRGEILELVPALRAFARALTRDAAEADDLLQEALLKALASLHQFRPGTNLRAWLFTIVRNTFYTNYRKSRRETPTAPEDMNTQVCEPGQYWSVKMRALHAAILKLPADQREALMLVGGAGMTYEEAAEICDCALGTIKSRVSRARSRLLELLDSNSSEEFLNDNEHWS